MYLCNGCDDERETIRAYCPSCEAVTESYKFERPCGSVDASALERKTMAWLSHGDAAVNLPARLDVIAGRRAS